MSKRWPSEKRPCYDCGSIVPQHHTPLCGFAEKDDILDLPQLERTQYWDIHPDTTQPSKRIRGLAAIKYAATRDANTAGNAARKEAGKC